MTIKINIEIETDNAAFDESSIDYEAKRIINVALDKVNLSYWRSTPSTNLIDMNGNKVGSMVVSS